eukprot:scaffold5884_cov110-Isochrysis_galbana.AAC.2
MSACHDLENLNARVTQTVCRIQPQPPHPLAHSRSLSRSTASRLKQIRCNYVWAVRTEAGASRNN